MDSAIKLCPNCYIEKLVFLRVFQRVLLIFCLNAQVNVFNLPNSLRRSAYGLLRATGRSRYVVPFGYLILRNSRFKRRMLKNCWARLNRLFYVPLATCLTIPLFRECRNCNKVNARVDLFHQSFKSFITSL